ncbi:ABC transporter ATP-binding protein [Halogeometricum limi]|uniref:NitT/TauT family transport system ATP-binding protein n=1 Tax=Halogeometricum limi TaxID=555875 RepID=A0A1I6ICH9_9EURY|nr:ABC transporter ATP-binding protein [Halogeometricum limi]SFR64324.1 NitT/TauT family transport system ATP-binding protein [Halogeometricum limi]
MSTKQSESVSAESIDSQSAASIHLENLGKTFDTKEGTEEVFSGIDLDIEPGTFVCLLGKSGSGKSTMLNIVSNVLEPTEGRVVFRNRDGSEDVNLGHVFQSPRLLPWNTCVQNIEYVHENNPDYEDSHAKRYLDLVGLKNHYNKYPTQLSGGQQQRVGIARALSIDPGVLLMDEPFSNLDEITAEGLREELVRVWQKLDKTVFFVTHDMTEAIQLSDRILMLGKGRIYGDLENPLDRPRELDSNEFLEFRQKAIRLFHSIED